MKHLSRIVSLLLASLMLLPALTACSESAADESASDEPTVAAEETVPSEVPAEDEDFDRTKVGDNLPDGLDFGGASFTILDRNNGDGLEHFAEEITGEVVNDAIFNRNKAVEDRLNVNYSVLLRSTWDTYGTELQNIRRDVQSGEELYQLINGYSINIVTLISEGLFQELSGMKYLDFSMPWWRKNIIDEMTIHDKLYFASGDINLSSIFSSNATFVNKKVQAEYGVENLYQTVRDGRWTLDKLSTLSQGIYVDLNGDGERNDTDVYGLACTSTNSIDGFMGGFRQKVTELNEEGYPELCMNTERMADIVSRVYALTYENEGVFRIPDDDGALMYRMFTNDQTLFALYPIYASLNYVREMESDYGILPTPKFEETQEGYGSYLQDGHNLICVPVNVLDTDMTSAVAEALAAEGYRYVVPAYFDTALSKKYSRDPESIEMLEIIRDSCQYNFGYVCCRDAFFTLRNMINTGKSDFASTYQRSEKVWTKQLQRILDSFGE